MHTSVDIMGSRATEVYLDLLGRIERGEFQAGERLPVQASLSSMFNVSLRTINKVVSQLADDGLVRARRGAGVFVRERHTSPRSQVIAYMYNSSEENLLPVQNMAMSKGFMLSVFCDEQNLWHSKAERLFLQQVKKQRCHALLAFCTPKAPRNDELLAEVEASGVRVLHIDHYRNELPDQPYMLPDYERAAHMAVMKLLLAGYSRIYLFSEPPATSTAPLVHLTYRGFLRALEEHGEQSPLEAHMINGPQEAAEAATVAKLAELPAGAGIVCLSHRHSQILLDRLKLAGRDVPAEFGVISIDSGGIEPQDHADVMSFQRDTLIERAMNAVMADEWNPPRELVCPTWDCAGTTR